jgi:hypothetical protein
VTPKDRPSLSKVDLGEAARQMICARLMLNGIQVFRPMTEDTPIDLLILKTGDVVAKCQCKYIWPAKGKGNHVMNLRSVRKNYQKSTVSIHNYTKQEVDYFLGYCVDNDSVFVIPFESIKGKKSLNFWIMRESAGSNGKENNFANFKDRFDFLK